MISSERIKRGQEFSRISFGMRFSAVGQLASMANLAVLRLFWRISWISWTSWVILSAAESLQSELLQGSSFSRNEEALVRKMIFTLHFWQQRWAVSVRIPVRMPVSNQSNRWKRSALVTVLTVTVSWKFKPWTFLGISQLAVPFYASNMHKNQNQNLFPDY